MDVVIVFLAFVLGVLVQRIYSARSKGFTKQLGASWKLSDNRLFRLLHRIYCELCPRRLYCERYKKEIAKWSTSRVCSDSDYSREFGTRAKEDSS